MPAGEAVDLIYTLPQGSLYKGALDPRKSWTVERYALADIYDLLFACFYRLSGGAGEVPQLTTRPGDKAQMERAIDKSREVKSTINNTEWEDV